MVQAAKLLEIYAWLWSCIWGWYGW